MLFFCILWSPSCLFIYFYLYIYFSEQRCRRSSQSVCLSTLNHIVCFSLCQCGVWETLLTALEILIRVHHPHQVFNIRQFLKAEVVHRFLLTCQVLQVPRCTKDV